MFRDLWCRRMVITSKFRRNLRFRLKMCGSKLFAVKKNEILSRAKHPVGLTTEPAGPASVAYHAPPAAKAGDGQGGAQRVDRRRTPLYLHNMCMYARDRARVPSRMHRIAILYASQGAPAKYAAKSADIRSLPRRPRCMPRPQPSSTICMAAPRAVAHSLAKPTESASFSTACPQWSGT
jgi:hypothetical protein